MALRELGRGSFPPQRFRTIMPLCLSRGCDFALGEWGSLRHLAYVCVVAVCATLVCLVFVPYSGSAGDFEWALRTAQALVEGRDPYDVVASAQLIPYPLPVALFGLPLLWLPWSLAAALFAGLSSALLAWGVLRSGKTWRLWILASFPFFYRSVFSPVVAANYCDLVRAGACAAAGPDEAAGRRSPCRLSCSG